MAEDRTPDPADQPEDDETQPREKTARTVSSGRFWRIGEDASRSIRKERRRT
jgi:hypothetical protein